jgi:hypothetical protein
VAAYELYSIAGAKTLGFSALTGVKILSVLAPSGLPPLGASVGASSAPTGAKMLGSSALTGVKIVGFPAPPGLRSAGASAGTLPFPASLAGFIARFLMPSSGPQFAALQVDIPCVLLPHFTHQCSNLHS